MTRKDYLIQILNRNGDALQQLREKCFSMLSFMDDEDVERMIKIVEKHEERSKRIEAGDDAAVQKEITAEKDKRTTRKAIKQQKEAKKQMKHLKDKENLSQANDLDEADTLLTELDNL